MAENFTQLQDAKDGIKWVFLEYEQGEPVKTELPLADVVSIDIVLHSELLEERGRVHLTTVFMLSKMHDWSIQRGTLSVYTFADRGERSTLLLRVRDDYINEFNFY